ncbi:MAG: GatB/YqeY domain-containing protein [bacterium]
MSLKSTIQDDIKSAMKAGQPEKVGTLRMLISAVRKKEIDEKIELDDNKVIDIISKMVKDRQDAIATYEKANRNDLAEQEKSEITILTPYLPAQLSESEVEATINDVLKQTNASSIKDMGNVMKELRNRLAGKTDLSKVGELVKSRLGA